jgi:DNA-binding LacI/PurR family transcriptional regulator
MTNKKTRTRISSIDVARLSGVSQSAVSRCFTPGASISVKSREKVLKAARELNYTPNIIARSLVQKATQIIGIIMTRYKSPFYSRVLGEFILRIQEQGYKTMLLNIGNDESVGGVLSTALQYQVDGLIITSATFSSTMVESCISSQTPVVLFNRYSMHNELSAVYCDGMDGGRKAADLLLPKHKYFACIKGEEESSTSRDRSHGFIRRLEEKGITKIPFERGDYSYESGYAAAEYLLNKKNPPDAIFCVSDLMAMGAMDAARYKFGLKIPEDISIMGFDNIEMASWSSYDLTTIRQPVTTMVNATIDQLFHSIKDGDETVIRKIKTELIQRSSTRL